MAKTIIPRQPQSQCDGGDQAVDVALGIVKMRGDANISFAQTGDDFLFHQFLIQLGGFFRRARGETAVGAALSGIERAGGDAAIFGQAFEQEIDQFARNVLPSRARPVIQRMSAGATGAGLGRPRDATEARVSGLGWRG